MKEILVVRHGKSDWSNPELDDFDRPLKKRGKRDAPMVGEFIKKNNLIPDLIATSPAKRAKQTANYIVEAIDYCCNVKQVEKFYHGNENEFYDFLRSLNDDIGRILIIGHNPGLELLVSSLYGRGGVNITLPTCALALLETDLYNWKGIKSSVSEIKALIPPKLIRNC